jgi:hypothetical protein
MTELITYIFEFAAMIISFLSAFILIKQIKQSQVSLGIKFLSSASIFLGLYALSTIIYSIMGTEWTVIVFLKFGMISILMSVLFLFYTMQVLIHSSTWLKTHIKSFFIILGIAVVISLILIFTDYINVVNPLTAETHFEPLPFYTFALFVAFILIYSIINIYIFGISKNTGESKQRMQSFLIGLLFLFGGLITDLIGNFFENEVLFDTLLFAFLAIGILFVTWALLRKK